MYCVLVSNCQQQKIDNPIPISSVEKVKTSTVFHK